MGDGDWGDRFRGSLPSWAAAVSLGAVAALIIVQLSNNEGKSDTTTLGL